MSTPQTVEQVVANGLPVFRKFCLDKFPEWQAVLTPLFPSNSVDFLATLIDLQARHVVIRKYYMAWGNTPTRVTISRKEARQFLEECFVGAVIPTLVWKGLETQFEAQDSEALDKTHPLNAVHLRTLTQYLLYFLETTRAVVAK